MTAIARRRGTVWSPAELAALVNFCAERNLILVSDEIHCDFVTKGQKYTPFASLPRRDLVDDVRQVDQVVL